jgi:hypothetical protein
MMKSHDHAQRDCSEHRENANHGIASHFVGLMAWSIALVALWQGPATAQVKDAEATASEKTEVLKLTQQQWTEIEKLPARFNGRLTTWGGAAKSLLLQISGTPHVLEGVPTIKWFVDFIAQHQDSQKHRVLGTSNAKLVNLLNQSERAAGKDGFTRFSLRELAPHFVELKKLETTALNKHFAERSKFETAVLDLNYQVGRLITLVESHDLIPANATRDKLGAFARRVSKSSQWNIVRIVPPAEKGEPWRTQLDARFRNVVLRVVPTIDFKRNEYANTLTIFLAAYAAQQQNEFTKALAKYKQQVAEIKASPVDFDIPKGWRENGISGPFDLGWHGDVLESGTTVLSLAKATGSEELTINASHFPGKQLDLATTVNGWRIREGQLPLTSQQISELKSTVSVSGRKCKLITVDTPANWPRSEPGIRTRSVSCILNHESGTWVISMHGPRDQCIKYEEHFQQFLKSFRLAEKAKVEEWLSLNPAPKPQNTNGLQMNTAVAKQGEWIWCFRMYGDANLVKTNETQVVDFMKQLEAHTGPIDSVDWKLPAGWKQQPHTKGFVVNMQANKEYAYGELIPFEATGDAVFPMLEFLNYFQRDLKQPALKPDQLKTRVKTFQAKNGLISLAQLTTPRRVIAAVKPQIPVFPPGPVKPVKNNGQGKGITFVTPKGWKAVPPGTFASVRFVAGKKNDVTISVTSLAAPNGMNDDFTVANINRWRQQVQLAAQDKKTIFANTRVLKVDGSVAYFVDLGGQAKKILGVITYRNKKAWFIKASGLLDAVDNEYDRFEEFAKTMKFN